MIVPQQATRADNPKLSICIATYNRGKFIGETLDSILNQLEPGVELIVVDGASPDNTQEVIAGYLSGNPEIRYYREPENSGVDRDYDKAVDYANGDYCWLMSDDDLLRPGAISSVLGAIDQKADLIVVNAEVRNADFSKMQEARLLGFSSNKEYGSGDGERVFVELARYLSYIGCVIVRRKLWLERDRSSYYGSLFVHVGVIFQPKPIEKVRVIADPLITIRNGNAMWTSRGFEIGMFKWPHLIWSFSGFSDHAKAAICPREPWKHFKQLCFYRALGWYTIREYRCFLSGKVNGMSRILALAIAAIPAVAANILASLYFLLLNRRARLGMCALICSPHATSITRFAARLLDV
jgi:glycosyltransferase involved in cell wall biosynthesis